MYLTQGIKSIISIYVNSKSKIFLKIVYWHRFSKSNMYFIYIQNISIWILSFYQKCFVSLDFITFTVGRRYSHIQIISSILKTFFATEVVPKNHFLLTDVFLFICLLVYCLSSPSSSPHPLYYNVSSSELRTVSQSWYAFNKYF